MEQSLELICLGRAGIDLYGEQIGGRLEEMQSFQKYVGGCPTNIAIGSARLGIQTALLTKVGNDHFGRFIIETLKNEYVNTSQIKSDPARLTALAILGIQNKHTFPLLFYRENCADMALSADDIDPAFIQSAKALVVTGTHFSSQTTSAASRKAMIAAKEGQTKIILDIDYRPVLWGATEKENGENRFVENEGAQKTLQTVLPMCDLIVGTEEEFKLLGGVKTVRQKTDAILVVKKGAEGCQLHQFGETHTYPGYPITIMNVLGAGDAFMSGFLRGWLRKESFATCCQWGNAAGALVVSRHGCAPAMPSFEELKSFIMHQPNPSPDDDPAFSHLHRASTRYHHIDKLCVLAFDHRLQLEKLVKENRASVSQLRQLKQLIAEAIVSLPQLDSHTTIGMIVDDKYGQAVLDNSTQTNAWIARPVEAAGEIPLRFESNEEIVNTLRKWPTKQIVKCLLTYHPEDRFTLKQEQEATLKKLFLATRTTGHEFLLELLLTPNMNVHSHTLSHAMERFYKLNIYPDWWKIAPPRTAKTWDNIQTVIQQHDSYCRGVLLLGQNLRDDQIEHAFELAAQYPICKGFAIGRNIFMAPSEKWLKGELDDQSFISAIAKQFDHYIKRWAQHSMKINSTPATEPEQL